MLAVRAGGAGAVDRVRGVGRPFARLDGQGGAAGFAAAGTNAHPFYSIHVDMPHFIIYLLNALRW